MSSKILASSIDKVHLFGRPSLDVAPKLSLGKNHRKKLKKRIDVDIKNLVSTAFFQTHFNSFLPTHKNEAIKVHIQINELEITVCKIDNQGTILGDSKTVQLDTTLQNVNEVQQIHRSVLEKANNVYKSQLDETFKHTNLNPEKIPQVQDTISAPLRPIVDPASYPLMRQNAALATSIPSPTSDLSREDYVRLSDIANRLENEANKSSLEIPPPLLAEFNNVAHPVRNAIFYQTYLLINPSRLTHPWPIGEDLFLGRSEMKAENSLRAYAIRHYLIHSLATDFAKSNALAPPQELLNRFHALPYQERQAVLLQLCYVQQRNATQDALKIAEHAFYGTHQQIATNEQRSQALDRTLINSVANYHREHFDAYEELVAEYLKKTNGLA